MDMLDGIEEEAEIPVVPEATGIFDNLVSSGGEAPNFEYSVGILGLDDSGVRVPIIGVTTIDQQVLVAVPDPAWHRQRNRRLLPENSLVRAVRVEVRCATSTDRSVPDEIAVVKIWLGILQAELYDAVVYGGDETACDVHFPSDPNGLPRLPYGEALLAVAQDHFAFLSAESQAPAPEVSVEKRLTSVEENISSILKELQALTAPKAVPLPSRQGQAPPATQVPRVEAPPGLDPHIAHQAVAAGVSRQALAEIGGVVGQHQLPAAPPGQQALVRGISSDEDEGDEHLGDGTGSGDPMLQAAVGLSNLVKEMRKDRKKQHDRSVEAILDRVDSGSTKDSVGGSTRSKSAALRALQKLLITNPKLLFTAIEQNMQDDWEMGGQRLPGAQITRISARGWLEHRSRIGGFPGTIRPAWLIAGIWDSLMAGRIDEARARAAIAVSCFDQMACDRGSWLLCNELTLEPAPPYSSFAQHNPPSQWEAQHSRLLDDRWVELAMSKVRDLSDYQDKRGKLVGSLKKTEDGSKADEKGGRKGKGKGGKKSKDPEEGSAPSAA